MKDGGKKHGAHRPGRSLGGSELEPARRGAEWESTPGAVRVQRPGDGGHGESIVGINSGAG